LDLNIVSGFLEDVLKIVYFEKLFITFKCLLMYKSMKTVKIMSVVKVGIP